MAKKSISLYAVKKLYNHDKTDCIASISLVSPQNPITFVLNILITQWLKALE